MQRVLPMGLRKAGGCHGATDFRLERGYGSDGGSAWRWVDD